MSDTKLNLDEIAARAQAAAELADKATPGPWEYGENDGGWFTNETVVRPAGEFPHGDWIADVGTWPENEPNAAFIAAARTDVPALAADVTALLAERAELVAEVARLRAALGGIQAMAAEELRTEELHLSTNMWQIEADARAALQVTP